MHKYLEQQKLMKLNKNSIQVSLMTQLENNEKELTKKTEASSSSQKQVLNKKYKKKLFFFKSNFNIFLEN